MRFLGWNYKKIGNYVSNPSTEQVAILQHSENVAITKYENKISSNSESVKSAIIEEVSRSVKNDRQGKNCFKSKDLWKNSMSFFLI